MENTIGSKVVLDKRDIKRLVHRNMALLLMGKLVSLFGSSIYSFAMGLYILQTTGSGLNFAITIALGSLPQVLFGPFAGVAADRFNRKKMVVYLDVLSGFVVLSLLGVSVMYGLQVMYIYIATFLLTTCSVFFSTPLSSSIPNLVDDENLTRVNSLSQSIQSISSIAGPAIGGMVFFLVDIRLFLLVNGLSFILSGISETFIDFNLRDKIYPKEEPSSIKEEVPKSNSKNSFRQDMTEGVKFIVAHSWLFMFASFGIFLNMLTMIGITIPMPYIVNQVWGFSSQQYGILTMTFPAGMLVGSLILSALPETKKNFKRVITGLVIVSTAIIGIGIVTSELLFTLTNGHYLIILMALFVTMAICIIFINVPINVTLQRLVPNEMRGRVFGTLGMASAGLTPIGAIIGGFLVDKISPWMLPMGCGAITLILSFLMYNNKELKDI